jgi:hypothetical protein
VLASATATASLICALNAAPGPSATPFLDAFGGAFEAEGFELLEGDLAMAAIWAVRHAFASPAMTGC